LLHALGFSGTIKNKLKRGRGGKREDLLYRCGFPLIVAFRFSLFMERNKKIGGVKKEVAVKKCGHRKEIRSWKRNEIREEI
jgi:hypothetical protein